MAGGFFTATRQLTGTPRVHHAYVYDRWNTRVVKSCRHRHRTPAAAEKCAAKMQRALMQDYTERRSVEQGWAP